MRDLIPAALYQCPQIYYETWVCRTWRALAPYHGRRSRGTLLITERNRAGECLCRHEITVNHSSAHGGALLTYFDYDHGERENVRFLPRFISTQDLWRSPLRRGFVPAPGAWYGTRVFGNRCWAKACDARTTGLVHKDNRLTPSVDMVTERGLKRARTPFIPPRIMFEECM